MKKLLALILILIPMQSFTMPPKAKKAHKKSEKPFDGKGLSPEQAAAVRQLRTYDPDPSLEGNGDAAFSLSAAGTERAAGDHSERLLRMMERMEFAFSKLQMGQGAMQRQLDDMHREQERTNRFLGGLITALQDEADGEADNDQS